MNQRSTAAGSNRRATPYATLALALASAFVFLFLQPRDRPLQSDAASFYVESGLAAIELPRFREYLQASEDADAVRRLTRLERATGRAPEHPVDAVAAIRALQDDTAFEAALRAGKVITATDPAYVNWKRNRDHFEKLSAMTMERRLALDSQAWSEPWRFVSYSLLHSGAVAWLTDLAVLALLGPMVEAIAGPALLLACFLIASAATGCVHLLLAGTAQTGDWGALAAFAGLITVTLGARRRPWRIPLGGRSIAIPAWSAVVLIAGIEALRWAVASFASVDLLADVSGLATGAALALSWRLRDSRRIERLPTAEPSPHTEWPRESSLVRQAREAATRLDTRRATQLYKEVVDLEPQRIEHLCSYLNVALLGPDEANLQDAALRLLWLRSKSQSEDLRRAFVLMTQPKVLAVLPIDEHLRLARRLVRIREDAAALKVLDAILNDDHLRQLYGRQLADCLLGIYTGYVRRRLTTLADTIRSRLVKYFEAPDQIGGVPPATRPPSTLLTSGPQSTRIERNTRS